MSKKKKTAKKKPAKKAARKTVKPASKKKAPVKASKKPAKPKSGKKVEVKKKATKKLVSKKKSAPKSKRKRTVQKPKPLFSTNADKNTSAYEAPETEMMDLPSAEQIDTEIEKEKHDENLLDGLTNEDVQNEADDYLKGGDEGMVDGQ